MSEDAKGVLVVRRSIIVSQLSCQLRGYGRIVRWQAIREGRKRITATWDSSQEKKIPKRAPKRQKKKQSKTKDSVVRIDESWKEGVSSRQGWKGILGDVRRKSQVVKGTTWG